MCSPLFEAFFLANELIHLIRLTVINHKRQLSKILKRLPNREMLDNRLYKYKQTNLCSFDSRQREMCQKFGSVLQCQLIKNNICLTYGFHSFVSRPCFENKKKIKAHRIVFFFLHRLNFFFIDCSSLSLSLSLSLSVCVCLCVSVCLSVCLRTYLLTLFSYFHTNYSGQSPSTY